MMRIGQSTDIHRLAEGRKLVLGGVEIPYEKGLVGHSDADALTHALAEAILGALALGDLGKWFPDTDPKWEGINSQIILKEVAGMMKEKGYHLGNADCLILIEKPKMAPHIQKMRENFALALDCSIDQISVKATRGEGLGFVGRGEGVAAQAVVLLEEDSHV
ncbi:MAG: 2-C-methyl-D-erythritol 2,4-cyclodiphosphate synthase [Bulleidia sp.]